MRFCSFSALLSFFVALLKNNADLLCVWSACVCISPVLDDDDVMGLFSGPVGNGGSIRNG